LRLGRTSRTSLAVCPGVDQIVHHQHAFALPAADRDDMLGHPFEHGELALRGVVVARDADRLDHPDAEPRAPRSRPHEPATSHTDDRLKRPGLRQPPSERPRVAVELVPRDGKLFPAVAARLAKAARRRDRRRRLA